MWLWSSVSEASDWESDFGDSVSLSLGSSHVFISDSGGFNNVDSISDSLMLGSHFSVELRNSSAEGDISIFFVHVDDSDFRGISEDDSVILNISGFGLKDLFNGEDFTVSLLDLLGSQEEPESRLGEC